MKSHRSSSAKARLEAGPESKESKSEPEVKHVSKRRPQSAFEGLGSLKKSQGAIRQNARLTICCVGEPATEKLKNGQLDDVTSPKAGNMSKKQNGETVESKLCIPSSLGPLGQWLCQGIPSELTGMRGECLMFLPSLLTTRPDDLKVVPPPQGPRDDLPFTAAVADEVRAIAPKKFDHPWKKLPVKEFKCNHGRVNNLDALRIYSPEGKLLHETCTGDRNETIVRKEIKELEDLMRGIGNDDGISVIVQYQAEIHELQLMLAETMPRVREIERREAEKLRIDEPVDTFGLRKFAKRHDEVMLRIKRQWESCVEELAILEEDLGIHTPKAHFKNRSKSLL